jgi:hypothetical protein
MALPKAGKRDRATDSLTKAKRVPRNMAMPPKVAKRDRTTASLATANHPQITLAGHKIANARHKAHRRPCLRLLSRLQSTCHHGFGLDDLVALCSSRLQG